MRRLQVGVALVQAVAHPVLLESLRLGGQVVGDLDLADGSAYRVLVEVVAQVHDEVQVFFGQVAVGGVVAVVPLLAGDEGEPEQSRLGSGVGCGAGAPYRADLPQGLEPVEVFAVRFQTGDLGVDGVGEFGGGDGFSLVDHAAEALVCCNLVADRNLLVAHAAPAVGGERVGGQAGPQDDPVGVRVPGGDPKGERVGAGGGGAVGRGGKQTGPQGYGGRRGSTDAQEAASGRRDCRERATHHENPITKSDNHYSLRILHVPNVRNVQGNRPNKENLVTFGY